MEEAGLALDVLIWVKNVVHSWQTLVAALIALGAAVWNIRRMGKQIKQQETALDFERRRYEETTRRKSMAASAELLDVLNDICNFTDYCFAYWTSDEETAPAPALVVESMKVIKASIEHVEEDAAKQLLELVRNYEVHNARHLHRQEEDRLPQSELQDKKYDTVLLRCLANRLFPFARNEVKTGNLDKPTYEEMKTAYKNSLQQFGIVTSGSLDNSLLEKIRSRH